MPVVKSPFQPVEVPEDLTIPEFVESHFLSSWNGKTFSECGLTGRKYTYQEVSALSRMFGAGLVKHCGLQRNDRIAIFLPNCPEFAIIILGSMMAGIVPVCFNPTYTATEANMLLKSVETSCIITVEALLPVVQQCMAETEGLNKCILIGKKSEQKSAGSYYSFKDIVEVDYSNFNFLKGTDIDTGKETAIILFSSGTTGLPKGVELTHQNIISNLLMIMAPGCTPVPKYSNENEEQKISIAILPYFHVYGIVAIMMSMGLCSGVKLVTLPKFEPATFIATLKKYKPNALFLVPPLVTFLASPLVAKEDLNCLDVISTGAAAMPKSLTEKFIEKLGRKISIQQAYGMTESSPLAFINPNDMTKQIYDSIGLVAASTTAKIVDENNCELGTDSEGELCIKGPQIMKGYFKNLEETKSMIDNEGFLHTGDVAYYDKNEYFYITGRLKEIIKVKGFQVSPTELESILIQHPKIADVAIIGVPSEKQELEEVPRAYIVKASDDLTEQEVYDYLDPKVSVYKRLSGGIEFIGAIPKAATGKILRKDIMELYENRKIT